MNIKNNNRFFLLAIFMFYSIFSIAQVDIKALDAYFEKAQKDWNIPGLAIGIVKDGKVVLAKGYGVLEEGSKTKVNENTVFAIASNTKAFISASIGILVEKGKLDWDDPVKKYLPYFELYDPWVTENITIRDLLCHRSGLGTFSGDVIWYKRTLSAEETVRKVKHLPQAFPFRSGYGYSNLMFITAGEIIKAVSGKSWDVFVKEHLFSPLKMNRSLTSVSQLEGMNNVASPHKSFEDLNTPIPFVNWDNMGAAGGILSSANDMAKWMQIQLERGDNGKKEIFSAETQLEFWTPHNNFKVNANNRKNYRNRNFSAYGLGWSIFDYQGKRVINHGGGYDGMYSKVALMPDENLGIVVLTNSMKGISTPLTYHTFDVFLNLYPKKWSEEGLERAKKSAQYKKDSVQKRIDSKVKGTKAALALKKFAGTYRCKVYGDIKIEYKEEQLLIHFSDAPLLDAKLSHWHYNTFKINWDQVHAWFDFGTVQFVLDNNMKVQELQFDVPNNDIFFNEIHAKRLKGS